MEKWTTKNVRVMSHLKKKLGSCLNCIIFFSTVYKGNNNIDATFRPIQLTRARQIRINTLKDDIFCFRVRNLSKQESADRNTE